MSTEHEHRQERQDQSPEQQAPTHAPNTTRQTMPLTAASGGERGEPGETGEQNAGRDAEAPDTLVIELVASDAPPAHGRTWTEADYAVRDAHLAALGVRLLRPLRSLRPPRSS